MIPPPGMGLRLRVVGVTAVLGQLILLPLPVPMDWASLADDGRCTLAGCELQGVDRFDDIALMEVG